MKFSKKSLGQNYLIDNNIIGKIVNLIKIKDRPVIEIGPGRGALTDKILENNPSSLIIIEKDFELVKFLKQKYRDHKKVKVYGNDILKFNLEQIVKKKL